MKPPRPRWPLLLLLGAAACAGAFRSLVADLAPDQSRFSHARHRDASIDCITCHEGIWEATSLEKSQLPREAKCLECHQSSKDSGDCAMCHTAAARALPRPSRPARLAFDHVRHLERTKEECTGCHRQLHEPGRDAPLSAGHAACQGCHAHERQLADARCGACHTDLTRYGLQPLTEVSHQGDFLRRHARSARAADASCALCHQQSFCLDCHGTTAAASLSLVLPDRPDRAFVHRGDFLSRHPLKARADPASCRKCHSSSSCAQCHQAAHVSPAAANPRNLHPPGWVEAMGGGLHGAAVRQDAARCAACHDQGEQSNCVRCHKVGAPGGDPHPPGYGARHTLREASTQAMCRTCHG